MKIKYKQNFILTDFEQATLDQLNPCKSKSRNEQVIKECVLLCLKWNRNRILLGLPIIT